VSWAQQIEIPLNSTRITMTGEKKEKKRKIPRGGKGKSIGNSTGGGNFATYSHRLGYGKVVGRVCAQTLSSHEKAELRKYPRHEI